VLGMEPYPLQDVLNGRKVWRNMCQVIWKDKVYVPQKPTLEIGLKHNNWRDLLKASVEDSKRLYITVEELCQIDWWFRFKWNAVQPEPQEAIILWKFRDDGTIAPADPSILLQNIAIFEERKINELTWELCNELVRAIDMETSELVSRILVNNFPEMEIRRGKNWGFIMYNADVIYSSFRITIPALNQ
jgi:hypothetical protein